VLAVARKNGFLTLQEEGVLAVAQGLTSLQELQRIMAPPKKA
jgi:type II secretory ATPase GspE/PulE/Tfp pilus assembly ATPase PilB-like protein